MNLKQEIMRTHAAVARGEAGAKTKLERLQAEFRTSGAMIERPGGSATLIDRPPAAKTRRHTAVSRTQEAPKVEIPELRVDATPKLTVKLGSGALREIQRELGRASAAMLSVIETGGNLIAGPKRLGVVKLTDATGPGADDVARRLPDAVMISGRHGNEVAEELRHIWQDEMLSVAGSWHTHPRPIAEPSATDRSGALLSLDVLREDRGWRAPSQWIDLILCPDARDGWDAPRVFGWATRRCDWSGAGITEPVRIEA